MTLDERKGRILKAIVNDYVETADPIGSEWLATHHDLGCKPATLRNEMAEMADLGYLLQPHTSAGRIPTDRGYRYYVDCLMPTRALSTAERQRALFLYEQTRLEVEEIVQQTCRLLANMTQYPSVATPPSFAATLLHHLYISGASQRHVLVVLLLSTGHVEHSLLEVGFAPDEAALNRVTNYLNEILAGRELNDLRSGILGEPPSDLQTDRALLEKVYANVVQTASALSDDRVFLEGTSHILRQREFQDVLRLERLISALEERHVLFRVLSSALLGQDVTVIIGSESQVQAMQDCSVVTSPYYIRERTGGFIGVVGPTRMHYDRTVAAVGLMACSLSTLLTQTSLG